MYGLAVIVVLCFYIWLAFWVVKTFSSYRGSRQWVWGVRTATALIFILIPTADVLIGHVYFNHLCSSEAAVKVYQPIELPAEYWANGKPNFYDETNGNLRLPLDKFEWKSRTEIYPFSVEKDISEMKERASGRILNERILFSYWGGWFSRNFTPHNTAVSCNSDVEAYTNYIRQIFVPVRSGK